MALDNGEKRPATDIRNVNDDVAIAKARDPPEIGRISDMIAVAWEE